MSKKLTQEEFIERAKQVHGGKYDYSKVEYINGRTKVCIICPEHGEFWQTPIMHLQGHGCKRCAVSFVGEKRKSTLENFIEKAKKIHGDKYDYSKVKYINSQTKVCIICPIHGVFWQKPNNHLNGQRCGKCYGTHKMGNDNFIYKAKNIHGDKYDYSKVNYINNSTPVCIICPEHGEFWQIPENHLKGSSCPKCSGHGKPTTEEFIEKAKKVHGNKYDYSNVEYVNNNSHVQIICPIHGEFWQTPKEHLNGCACPKCKQSKLENEIGLELSRNKIVFDYRCHPKWLEGLELDFYIPNTNIAIECQGIQHYESVERFGGEEEFKNVVSRDKRKAQLCEENGIKLLYFTHYPNINEEGNIYKNKDKLLEEILHNVKSI